ncbi:MAG: hypothetical protein BWY09_01525 [Candidatus Hydrogenedentes bacterium ADurb.Bin179]|nr:MAG: hypothetical protein BWY09_01525 [Candidatus Hydrogenedentes bacterium ADurb.Bin179]
MRTDVLLLQDMLDAINEVLENTPGDSEVYYGNKYLRSHLVRNIQIIGEAAARISDRTRESYPAVPWRLIIGMRHVIVHDYFEIDWQAVYDTSLNLKTAVEFVAAR